jgi:hypothetical protein
MPACYNRTVILKKKTNFSLVQVALIVRQWIKMLCVCLKNRSASTHSGIVLFLLVDLQIESVAGGYRFFHILYSSTQHYIIIIVE